MQAGPPLLEIVKFRNITTLKLVHPMDLEAINELGQALTAGSFPNCALQRLVMEMHVLCRREAAQALISIGTAASCISSLEIYSLDIDALVRLNFIFI